MTEFLDRDEASRAARADAFSEMIMALATGSTATAEWLSTLEAQADAGNRTAQAALRNPWATSETPERARRRLIKSLRRTESELVDAAPSTLALVLQRLNLLNQLSDHDAAQPKTPVISADGLSRLSQAGIADWMIDRLSAASLGRVGEVVAEAAAGASHYDTVGIEELRVHGLIDRVSADPSLPAIPIKPTRCFLSANFDVDAGRPLPKSYWDGVVKFADFKSFYRAGVVDKSAREWEREIDLPPYRDVAEWCRFDARFAAAFEEGKFWGGVMEDWLFDDPDSDDGDPIEPWDWAGDQFENFRRWPAYWHAFRPFGEIFDALRRTEELLGQWDLPCAWLFYLHGRNYKFRTKAEKRVREFFFDFIKLPVLSYGAPAYRILVPTDLLKKGGVAPGETAAESDQTAVPDAALAGDAPSAGS